MDAESYNSKPGQQKSRVMRDTIPRSTKTAPLLHLFNRNKAASVSFENDTLTVHTKSGRIAHAVDVDQIKQVHFRKLLLLTRLTVLTQLDQAITVHGLYPSTTQSLYDQLWARVDELRNDEAAAKAHALTPEIFSIKDSLTALLTPNRYIRPSRVIEMQEAVGQLAQKFDEITRQKLDPDAAEALRWTEDAVNSAGIGKNQRQSLNESFLDGAVPEVGEATRDIFKNGLTGEQARDIAVDEDATLILAGAGAGKTAVITGKIAHLVRTQDIRPESILALAFNRKAALEIRERLPEDLKGAQVSTFHSFALKVVASQGAAPTISKLAQDDFAHSKALDSILEKMMAEPKTARSIIQMASSFSSEYRDPFDFTNPTEYEEYVRDAELRTLNGELVKSFEELTVANFLAAKGLKYTYENPYEFITANREHRQYQPDFHISEYDIYIEHFALNEQGKAPAGWSTYTQEAQWKRNLHAQRGTKLIETYSWQYRKGVLESSLEQKLSELGVKFDPVPEQALVRKLSQERLSWLSHLLRTFLNHAKSSNLSHKEILGRAGNQKDKDRTRCFLEIFQEVREGYEELLREEGALDFHDLINEAAETIRNGRWENPFRYVLIDEFQDISNGRITLAKALRKPDLAYFLVGDDWQSIYRFAGSYVGLIHQVEEHLGFTRRESLTRTFRFGDGILRPSTGFVQQNPEQTKRTLEAYNQDGDLGITVIPSELPETGLHQALREIEEVRSGPGESIMVLGRYRGSRSALGRHGRGARNLHFNTVHSTKGQEADYVIVLDLKDGRYGFPCKVEDDPLLTIVMPPNHGDPYPFAEERRLFYVALTRARKAVFLITDPGSPSPFVRELVKNCAEVKTREGWIPQCPACTKGSLVPSASGENLRCINFPQCEHLAPRCLSCKQGYVTIQGGEGKCSNPGCDVPHRVCPRCKTGILVPRSGHSPFWGCSLFSCRYTTPRVPG